jgi:hypothetical protein
MTDEERLAHERLIVEIKAIRDDRVVKSWWRELLQSSVVAALLTATVGSFGAGIVIARYQAQARRDELALADRKASAQEQQRAVEQALALLAEGEYHARGRYALTRRRFQADSVPPAEADALRRQREKIITSANDFDAVWPAKKKTLEGLLKRSFPLNADVRAKWTDSAAALEKFVQDARAEYDAYLKNPAVTVDKPPLSPEADSALRTAITNFTNAVERPAQREE